MVEMINNVHNGGRIINRLLPALQRQHDLSNNAKVPALGRLVGNTVLATGCIGVDNATFNTTNIQLSFYIIADLNQVTLVPSNLSLLTISTSYLITYVYVFNKSDRCKKRNSLVCTSTKRCYISGIYKSCRGFQC